MKEFKILAVGDIVGTCGIYALEKKLDKIIEDNNIDFVIANGENAAMGSGLDKRSYERLKKLNIDCITMGNHTWGKKEIFDFIDGSNIIRPYNLPKNIPGKGYMIFEKEGKKIAVVNMIGRVAINVLSDNPFLAMEKLLNKLKEVDYIIVDLHAEATAEKIAFARYFDGKVSAIFGTHTHVQTADNEILEKNTGYISDIGMTGSQSGVIGMQKEVAYKRFIKTLPERYSLAPDDKNYIMGAIYTFDEDSKKCIDVSRLQYDIRINKYIVR